jgi:hypothetical protein
MTNQWRELARRISEAERRHRGNGQRLWIDGDVIEAVKERWTAVGLDQARELMLDVTAEPSGGEPNPLDAAMHSVWLHGNWRFLTSQMTTEEREAAADAVQRHNEWANRQDDDLGPIDNAGLRWWRE